MTSKISYFKFIEADIKHRGWLVALTAILMFLFLPVYSLISIDNMKATIINPTNNNQVLEWIHNSFPGMLNGSSHRFIIIFIGMLAILCAVTGFAYLHSRDKQDFYHSMPLSRTQWFSVSYLSGLLIFIVPYLFFGAGTILMGYAQGLLNQDVLVRCVTSMIGGMLGFLLCYSTSILAMFLTGRIVTGVLASLVLLIYGSIITALFEGLAGSFFDTWSTSTTLLPEGLWNYSSPGALYLHILYATAYHPMSLSPIIGTLISVVLLLGISILLYRCYPAEAAENALAFPKSASVIKFFIAVPTALFLGLFVNSLYYNSGTHWIVFISILAVLLLCLVIEFIYHADLKQLLAGKISTGLSVGAVLILLCILNFDLLGYDTYLPKETKLANMSVYTDNFSGYFTYPESYEHYDLLTAPDAAITDYAPLYSLAEQGIQNTKQGVTPQVVEDNLSTSDFIIVTLRFGLESGKNAYRRYAIDRAEFLSTLGQLCQDDSYREELFPVFHLNRDNILRISLQDIYFQPEPLSLSKEQQDQLLDAYEKDVLNVEIADLQYESPIGELLVELPDNNTAEPTTNNSINTTQLSQFYIYRTYQNTLSLLEQYGYSIRTKIDPGDVMLITYYPNEGTTYKTVSTYSQRAMDEYKFGNGIQINNPEEIAQFLNKISYDECIGLLGQTQTATGSVEITLNGKSYPITYILLE